MAEQEQAEEVLGEDRIEEVSPRSVGFVAEWDIFPEIVLIDRR